ncbi:MAG: hypothetical protein G01um101493_55 [Microgenomates group bacterium Gr01-1014_93]|nr:MAG: hypothetical protein G01um101493_55 [Microgenomates group bacterium Gr01-1014_93]
MKRRLKGAVISRGNFYKKTQYLMGYNTFMSFRFLFLNLTLVGFLAFYGLVSAQSFSGAGEIMSIFINPENPNSGEEVVVSVSAPGNKLDGANVVWTIDEKGFASGVGIKEIKTTAPAIGNAKVVNVSAIFADGSIHEQSIVLGGARVFLIWEPRTYTPQMYLGKALHSKGAYIVFQAIPNFKDVSGNTINPKDLVYTWRKNGDVVKSFSGYGKDSLEINDSEIDSSMDIGVEVSSRDGSFTSSQTISTSRGLPFISLYKHSLLFGTNFSEQRETTTGTNEIGVRAVPFFFPTDPEYPFLFPALSWKLLGKVVDTKNLPYLIIQNQNNNKAVGDLSVSIKNPNFFGEDIPTKIQLKFE